MVRFISFFLVCWAFVLSPVQAQRGFNGTFLAVVDGMTCRLTTKTSYNIISGAYDEGGFSLQVIGTFYGRLASGDLKDPSSGAVVATFSAVLLNNNTLELTFSLSEQKRNHVFVREGTTATQPKLAAEKHACDPRLVGNWNYQVITGDNGSGFQTMFYLQVTADGRYAQYSKSIGGGKEWAYDSGKIELQQQGLCYTQNNVFYIKVEDQPDYIAAANYSFHEGKLITEDVSGRKIWTKD